MSNDQIALLNVFGMLVMAQCILTPIFILDRMAEYSCVPFH